MEKTERFGFLLSKDEKDVVVQLAEIKGGLSKAALIRLLIRSAGRENGLLNIKREKNEEEPQEENEGMKFFRDNEE